MSLANWAGSRGRLGCLSRLGEKRLAAIDTALTDDLYEKLLVLKITDDEGNVIERERRTTVNHAMKSGSGAMPPRDLLTRRRLPSEAAG